MNIGETAQPFELPATDGSADGPAEEPTAVVFTCNHCPYALAWHERLIDVARDYADRGARVLFVNSNDAERYPRDSFEAMKERVEADGGWPAPYLHDESQEVARGFGALTTPMSSSSTATECCATVAPPTATTRIPRPARPGSATPSTPSSRAVTPTRRRPSRWGAASSGGFDQPPPHWAG